MGPRFKVSSKRLEKPGMELMTPGLEGKWLNHYTTEASNITGMDDMYARKTTCTRSQGHFGPFLIAHNTVLYEERVILLTSECPREAL